MAAGSSISKAEQSARLRIEPVQLHSAERWNWKMLPSCSHFPNKVFEKKNSQFRDRQKKYIFFMGHQRWYQCFEEMILHSVDWLVFPVSASLVGEVASILSSCRDNTYLYAWKRCTQGLILTFWAATQLLGRLWLVELQQCFIFHLEKHSHCTLSSAPSTTERCEAADSVARLSAKKHPRPTSRFLFLFSAQTRNSAASVRSDWDFWFWFGVSAN